MMTAGAHGALGPSPTGPQRVAPPETRHSVTHQITITPDSGPALTLVVSVGLYESGKPCEVFVQVKAPERAGRELASLVAGFVDGWAIQFSIALQYGAPLELLTRKCIGHRFQPAGTTSNPAIAIATSVYDYIGRWMRNQWPA